ncbi:hypothetical protein DFJ58DRAFT_725304 [Suillus subalutaceus]|uniref:uncharacterized protein n=1 Tax=Suillus subalutaceus TaxID=48586 RepID=UPI001B87430A|nr:uncharacterized protein DFJ58DRAFT_725304 [Suillus subalutaceus]KAG1862821.1 hypothetical protein DFJ58DRAFT_725304 [Suillus subalutaceus]
MSHLSAQMLGDDSDDDWDEGNVADPISIISGPNASKGDLMDALKAMQLEIQQLRDDNRTLKENNKVLVAEKPKRKQCVDAPDALVAHEQTISLYAREYGMMVEMFPDSELLMKKCLDLCTPFNSIDRYKTSATQESAFLDELYTHFPERIHDAVMGSMYFKDLVNKCITDARSNEIKKLCGVAGDIFNLPGKYFANVNYDRAGIADIQKMLGVSGKTQAYKIFPPLLFPGLQEDATLKTVFGNWTLVAKWSFQQVTPGSIAWAAVIAIFLLSPDTEFPGSGVGKSSTLNYKDLFFQYKKLLIAKWGTKRIKTIVTNINNHVFGGAKRLSDEINRAMLALDMETDSEEDTPPLSLTPSAVQVLSAPSAPSAPPVLSAPPILSAPEGPNLDIQPTNMEESASRAAVHANNQLNTNVEAAAPNDGEETDVVSGLRGRGRGKTRGKKATTQGPTRRGRSGVKVA